MRGSKKLSPARVQLRALDKAERAGHVPEDLRQHPVWQAARRRKAINAGACMALWAAWSSGDAAEWARALGQVVT